VTSITPTLPSVSSSSFPSSSYQSVGARSESLDALKEMVHTSKRLVVVTGAGISTDSGIYHIHT
jgi:hypothetical protein